MITQFDYAALSAAVYNNVRGQDNKLTLPTGWTELPIYPNGIVSSITGFTARAYSNGTDIVIAYKGTDTVNVVQTAQDFLFGNPAAIGGSIQLVQAALFYEQVKAQYGGNITFTGHSLGGGLASVMGVWFGKSATTFAQAPFELAAANPAAIAAVEAALALNLYADSDFLLFNPLDYAARQANITNYFVHGEVLSQVLAWLPNVVGTNNPIIVGGEQNVSAGDLHSMILHATLIMQPALRLDSYALPNLMAEIFDRTLYFHDPNTPDRDFLSSLLNDQIRVGYTNADGLLARFAGDIDKLTQYGTNLKDGALGKALIDTAIADYYFMQAGFTHDFFNAVTGGISFDLADIGANWSGNKTVGQLDAAIANQYLNGDQTARSFLSQDNYWSIQSGANALNATGTGSNNDAMIGGTTNDTLDGGAGNDFLYGGDGIDTLTGGTGNDLLIGGMGDDTLNGGTGYDTYTLEGNDTIRDADGNGMLKDKAGNILSGVIEKRADGTYAYLNDPSAGVTLDAALNLTLTLADGTVAVIENFQSGNLGLQLSDTATQTSTTTITGDISPDDIDPAKAGIQAAADANGNPVGQAGVYADILGGTAGNDHILSGELNDDVGGGAGDDHIEGGAGNDYLHGGAGNDVVEGNADSDIVAGEAGNDQLYGNTKIDTATAIANGSTGTATNLKGDWLAGGTGDDILVTGADNDILSGGEGSDLLIAGAGDDHILGDTDYLPTFQWPVDANNTIDPNAWAFSMNGTNWYHSQPSTFDWSVTPNADGSALFQPVTQYAAGNSPAAGNDIIYAGDGADRVWAGSGGDVVYGESGNDTLDGEDGNDVIFGGAGDDVLYGDGNTANTGADYLDGGDGNDALWGGNGDDVLAGGIGDDKLYGEAGANYLEGGDGNDLLNSGGPGSSLYGGAGDDNISAAGGGNTLDGGAGNDTLAADGGDNYLDGGDGANTLQSTGNSNALFAGTGNDNLAAWGNGNYLDAGNGNNTLYAQGVNNELHSGTGNDNIQATGGNNRLDGGNGTNTLVADMGGNTLISGVGNDTLSSTGGNSTLDGGAGNDTLIADTGGNTLYGGAGDDTLSSAGGNSALDGGAGNDVLITDTGGNTLIGGAGDDRLSAGTGGNNTLNGGDGMDIYIFDAGFGTNHLADTGSNIAQFNFSFAGSGIAVGLGSLKLSFANGDVLHIDGFDPNDPAGTCSIDTFVFDDQTLSLQTILDIGGPAVQPAAGPDITGTANADTLQGTAKAETIRGLAGNDTIDAGAGNDTLEGGDGDDTLDGGSGADVMKGGAGNDTYIVDNAADTVSENVNEGWDAVQSQVSYTLGQSLNDLTLTGTGNINGTGNALDNYLTGNGGNNILSGDVGVVLFWCEKQEAVNDSMLLAA